MFKGSYDHPLVKPFAKIMGVIPISSQLRPREMIQSLRTATQALKDGEVVCIFPEGQMTRIGQMLPFRRGMERIVKGVDVPIIPVNLGGVWGSIFSFRARKVSLEDAAPDSVSRDRDVWKADARDNRRTGSAAGGAGTRRRGVSLPQALHADAASIVRANGAASSVPLCHGGRAHPESHVLARLLPATVFLARRLRSVWLDQKMVGILLPPSVPGALDQHGRAAHGEGSRQSELHGVQRSFGVVRQAVRTEDGDHVEGLSGTRPSSGTGAGRSCWRILPTSQVHSSD